MLLRLKFAVMKFDIYRKFIGFLLISTAAFSVSCNSITSSSELPTVTAQSLTQSKTVATPTVGGNLQSARTSSTNCLKYEPAVVNLSGAFKRRTFPGRPNYESVKKGDEPETVWILQLNKPVCVEGDANIWEYAREENISEMQLILTAAQYKRYKRLHKKLVLVGGKLLPQTTGHHHTKIMLEAAEIKELKSD